jgi:hypothetical protein
VSFIFDGFPSDQDAARFAAAVKEAGLEAVGPFDSQAESDAEDPFPFQLDAPIVHVERPDDGAQDARVRRHATRLAEAFGGRFAGT